MNKRLLVGALLLTCLLTPASAQRVMDKIDRGIVAVPAGGGYFVSWRKLGEEYYDTKYNLYRNGTLIASDLEVSNYTDGGGSSSSTYQVEAIINGVTQEKSAAVQAWDAQYKTISLPAAYNRDGDDVTSVYGPNDISLADVDGDGIVELFLKRNNEGGDITTTSNKVNFHHYEVYDLNGNRLWWIDLGPNMMAGADEQWDMIGYDWDQDGKAEALMRGADNMIIHTASGDTIYVGDMTYDNGDGSDTRSEYTHEGAEYLLYLDGATGVPFDYDGSGYYTPPAYPLPRFETGESDYATVWGTSDTGHRSCKHYFGAPYLDGVKPSIFLGRGCYTRHKMCALDVDPTTHELTQRWRWNTYSSSSPWYGNGFHNFAIGDVDMDGRDEIMFGSMCIDDNGKGLSTTGLGHGDAQHLGDLDPYRWGLEQFNCNETSPSCTYWNPTTGELYYRKASGTDDGRALAGNFTNDYPGGQGRTVSSGMMGLSSDEELPITADDAIDWGDLNCRIYWDGDLLDEIFDSPGVARAAAITKWGNGRIFTSSGNLNNSSKNNPCALGDILGDWREEFIIKSGTSSLLLYTTNTATEYPIYSLWEDHEYRNAMAWQCVGYNQPPHTSFFLGETEGITVAPPPVTLNGRTTVANGGTINTTTEHLLITGDENMTINVSDGASPWIVTDNAPSIVSGSGNDNDSRYSPERTVTTYTHTLTGGAFTGATRVVKQGEGILVLPNVTETYTGETNVWQGTLQFDGTMESSKVWLNRHTKLSSNGGNFKGGIQADYNATIYPGGEANVGTISASKLDLRFGSRVVLDVNGTEMDQLNADTLAIETKDWEYGPKYSNPVVELNALSDFVDGTYDLGTVSAVEGSIDDISIEGSSTKRVYLTYADSHLYLNIETLRDGTDITWNGTADENQWDFGVSETFLNGTEKTYAGLDDNITFNDDAENTTVAIKGEVQPKSLTFNNTKAYTITGGSIINEPTLTKLGSGTLTFSNDANYLGNTAISEGTLIVKSLANDLGNSYGSLGDINKTITLSGGATLQNSKTLATSQTIIVNGEGTINTPSGTTFSTYTTTKGDTLTKTGDGTLALGDGTGLSKLVLNGGTLNTSETSAKIMLPATVEIQSGTISNPNDMNSYTQNSTNFVVPEGGSGTLYTEPRENLSGTLSGAGTFTVYDTGVRTYFSGDWSAFEGTLVAQVDNWASGFTNETFDFNNSYGMPKATLNVPSGITVTNNGYDFEVGSVSGTGTLSGDGSWIVGSNDANFTFTPTTSSKVIKRGEGRMMLLVTNKVQSQLQVDAGSLAFALSTSTAAIGSSLTVNNDAAVTATGLVSSITLNDSSSITPMSVLTSKGGTFKTSAVFRMNGNSTAHFLLTGKSGSAITGSKIECGNFLYLKNVEVELGSSYTPAEGDSIVLWTCTRVMSQPTSITLPTLPDGLEWDSTSLSDGSASGVLKVVAAATGIKDLLGDTEANVEIYTVGGVKVGELTTTSSQLQKQLRAMGKGTYIIRSANGTRKIDVR